jgi:hypothetical protein
LNTKGTFHGRAILAIAAFALVLPGAALADLTGAPLPTAAPAVSVPSLPAVPAAPTAPELAAPVPAPPVPTTVSTPVASATVEPATPAFAASTPTTAVKVAPGTITVGPGSSGTPTTEKAKAKVTKVTAKAVGKAQQAHKQVVKASPANPTIEKTVTVTVDPRRLSGGGGTDPLSGCTSGWMTCQTIPDFPYSAENDCNQETIPFVGRFTLWTKLSTNPISGTVTMTTRSYFVGFNGQGSLGNIYTGYDQQNDVTRTFALGPVTVDHADTEILIVNRGNAPNQYMYFRTITRFDPAHPLDAQVAVYGPYVVCQKAKRHSKDDHHGDHGDDDDDGHHHSEGYKGYNNDRNDWDD